MKNGQLQAKVDAYQSQTQKMIDKMAELTRENENLRANATKISAANEGLQQKLDDAQERE